MKDKSIIAYQNGRSPDRRFLTFLDSQISKIAVDSGYLIVQYNTVCRILLLLVSLNYLVEGIINTCKLYYNWRDAIITHTEYPLLKMEYEGIQNYLLAISLLQG
jgi:hypothetical protein